MRYQTPRCQMCHQSSVLDLDEVAVLAWQGGLHIQNAFPHLSADSRELILTGTHPSCWDEMMGDSDD